MVQLGEDSSSQRWLSRELLPEQTATDDSYRDDAFFAVSTTQTVFDNLISLSRQLKHAAAEGLLFSLSSSLERLLLRAKFALHLLNCNSLSNGNKRHRFYLVVKKMHHIPIAKEETVVQTYLDFKRIFESTWSFMWEVNDVKSDKIICCDKQCWPMSSYNYLDFIRDERVNNYAIEVAKEWASGNHGRSIDLGRGQR
eukprot:GHVU01210107.1.p2 GENE.GHVU01210107.1~~GHVU01210107.1.p2  ORF type:complete len:197 (+),score=24.29 GHVU01210107.1:2668-3258(+)